MRPSRYIIHVPLPGTGQTLLFHGYSGAVDLVTNRVARLLRARTVTARDIRRGMSKGTRRHLQERGYLTDMDPGAEEAYVVELGTRVHRVLRKHNPAGFLVIPTYGCNLRCTYCYEKGLREKGRHWMETRMSPDRVDAVLDAMDRIDGGRGRPRALTYYGGEALQKANGPVIRRIHQGARDRGFRRFAAVTNAVDLHHFQDLLGPEQGISFLQVTLDGPDRVHDSRRVLPGGRGTFHRIVRNIDLALGCGVKVSVRTNVDPTNAGEVGRLEAFFHEKGWTENPLFRSYCSPVHDHPCKQTGIRLFASHLEMEQAIEKLSARKDQASKRRSHRTDAYTQAIEKRLLAHLLDKQELPFWRTAFCGSNLSMYLFDPFGDLYPCWEVIGQPEHRIGRYGPGFVDIDAAAEQWHGRSVVRIHACRSCPYLFFCGGGCEALAFRSTGSLAAPHCFEFPRHFHKAARSAFEAWNEGRDGKKRHDPGTRPRRTPPGQGSLLPTQEAGL